jgi:hypothetical protein
MREELVDYEEPAIFNEFVRALKRKMLAGDLGGDRTELWYFVRKGKLGLIENKEVDSSTVEDDEARQVSFVLWILGLGANVCIVSCCQLRYKNSISLRPFRSQRRITRMILMLALLNTHHMCRAT